MQFVGRQCFRLFRQRVQNGTEIRQELILKFQKAATNCDSQHADTFGRQTTVHAYLICQISTSIE